MTTRYLQATYECIANRTIEKGNLKRVLADNGKDSILYFFDGRIYNPDVAKIRKVVSAQEAQMYREAKQNGFAMTAEHNNIVTCTELEQELKNGNIKKLGVFAQSPALQRRVLAGENFPLHMTERDIDSVMKTIERNTPTIEVNHNTQGIVCLADCAIEIQDNNVIKHKHCPSRMFTGFIDIQYNMPRKQWQPAYEKLKGYFLDWANGNQTRAALLEEPLATTLENRKGAGKLIFIINQEKSEKGAGNGKSTYLKLINRFLGKGMFGTLHLEQIAKNNHELASIVNKAANLADDNSEVYIETAGIIKSIATGADIPINPKGLPTYSAYVTTTLIFSFNDLPKIKDTSQGMKDRLLIIPFGARFRGEAKEIKEEVMQEFFESAEARRATLQIAIEAMQRIKKHGYSIDAETEAFTDIAYRENMIEVDSVSAYIEDVRSDDTDGQELFLGNYVDACYAQYKQWCNNRGRKEKSDAAFSKQILSKFSKLATKREKYKEKYSEYEYGYTVDKERTRERKLYILKG